MWPPSSGSSGMKLNMPMKKLKPAISIVKNTSLSVADDSWWEATSPARRPPPTMLTGPVGSRSSSPTMAWATSSTFAGRDASAWTTSTVMPPICSMV